MTRIVFIGREDSQENLIAQVEMQKLIQSAGLAKEFRVEVAFVGGPVEEPFHLLQNRDYDRYDLLIGMEQQDLQEMYRICGGDFSDKMFLFWDLLPSSGKQDPRGYRLSVGEIQEGGRNLLARLRR